MKRLKSVNLRIFKIHPMNSFSDIILGHLSYLKECFQQLDIPKLFSTMKDEALNTFNYQSMFEYLLSEEFKIIIDDALKTLVPRLIVCLSLYFLYLSIAKPKNKNFERLFIVILHAIPVIAFSLLINIVFIEKGLYVLNNANYILQVTDLIGQIFGLFLVAALIYASYLYGVLNNFYSFVFNCMILGLYCFTNQSILEQLPKFLNPNTENIVTSTLKVIFGKDYLLFLGDYSSIIIYSLLILSAITVLYIIANFICHAIQFAFELIALQILFVVMSAMFVSGFYNDDKGLSFVDSTDTEIVWEVRYFDDSEV